jgi:hypothetical protein
MRMTSSAMPWTSETHEAANATTPSWIAPRRVSASPFIFPRATQPPQEIVQAPRISAPPSISAVPSFRPAPPSVKPPPYPDLREENAALKAQLEGAVMKIAMLREELLEASEPEVVRLACAIGERIAGRALEGDPAIVVEWAREGLAALAKTDGLVVAIAPDLAKSIAEEAWSRLGAPHALVVDASLPASSCELRAGGGRVAIGATARAACIAAELGASR